MVGHFQNRLYEPRQQKIIWLLTQREGAHNLNTQAKNGASMAFDSVERILRDCPVCQSKARTEQPRYSKLGWTCARCDACGFLYLTEAPVYAELSQNLAWTQQFEKEKKRRKEKQPLMAWFDQATRWRLHMFRDDEWAYITERVEGGRVLDVGCGTRNNIPERYTPFGIEIEKSVAEATNILMQERGGHVVHAPALSGFETFEDAFFDGIIMRSYLEHEERPKAVLQAAHTKLRPEGTIYIKVPNFGTLNRRVRGVDWCGFRFPDHLNYFNVSSLRRLACETGYRFELRNKLTRLTNDNMHVFLTRL